MNVIAGKNLQAGVMVGLDVSGREHLVIMAKATWSIPGVGERPRPIEPRGLESSDVFVGEPGRTAMLYGSDFVRFKPRCDVLFNASAHAPSGQAVPRLLVGWQVGPLRKGLQAVGQRVWRNRLGLIGLSSPQPFSRMPLHFGLAFGGTRSYRVSKAANAEVLHEALPSNPEGIGWFGEHSMGDLDGAPAPCLESVEQPISQPGGKYAPLAFSAVARHWEPRKNFAGTYDEAWQKNVFPFLPEDFDEQFHQCAPTDQQMPYPKGGEQVVLHHMLAGQETVRFRLPVLDSLKVRVLRADYSTEMPQAVVDTLYFEPDEARFTAVWRTSVPLRRRIQEFSTIAVGPVDPDWWDDMASGRSDSTCRGCSSKDRPAEAEDMEDEE